MSSPNHPSSFRLVTDRDVIESLTSERQAWTALWEAVTHESQATRQNDTDDEPYEARPTMTTIDESVGW